MIQLLKDNQDAIADLCKRTDVVSLSVFGSAARVEDYVLGKSDIDLLVTFGPDFVKHAFDKYFLLINELEELFGARVGIVTESQLTNPYLIESINHDRALLYAA
jgi:uncharacterized protein